MPKPLKKAARKAPAKPKRPKRPSDPNRAAHAMIAEHMSRFDVEDKPDFQTQYKAHMAKLGAKGGKKGGKRRMETLTRERRIEIARKAAAARWKDRQDK